ncbi:hypothetical protein [Endozoicomonas sp. SCSIO W0465]|uniref:hypothetical protein n=1 Tax=Endozoicomonas sp. SCSIO W0465 TaxID=2918516 RepID=UPI002074F71A|nr:hypothetical protein [Endozoicomonas sp. SCSIO W0465]USE34606.1 hypothetical protein MJO57_21025 [Endozoicomonas sp. SCSIO W0465]
MERKHLNRLALDIVAMEGASRSIKSDNRRPWQPGQITFSQYQQLEQPRVQMARRNAATIADTWILEIMKNLRSNNG